MDAQGWAGWTAPRPAGSPGLSRSPLLRLDTLGSRTQARARSRQRMAGSLCSLELTPGGQLHVKGSQAAVRPCCLGRAWLRAGPRRPREPRAWPQQQKAMALVSRSLGCRSGHRVPDHPAWRVPVDRGIVTAAVAGKGELATSAEGLAGQGPRALLRGLCGGSHR